MVVKNLKELERELRARVDYALLTDVAEVVTTVMTDHIERDVYDVYEQFMYERRHDNGGLDDVRNINSSIEGNTLIVENNTWAKPYYYNMNTRKYELSINAGKELTPIIETGWTYDIGNWDYYGVPRPFIHNTIEDLRDNKYHVVALKQGLKRQGIEVK